MMGQYLLYRIAIPLSFVFVFASAMAAAQGDPRAQTDAGHSEIIIPLNGSIQELVVRPRPEKLAAIGWDAARFERSCSFLLVEQQAIGREGLLERLVFNERYLNSKATLPLTDLAEVQVRPITFLPQQDLGDIATRLIQNEWDDKALNDLGALQGRARNIVPLLLPSLEAAKDGRAAHGICFALGLLGPQAADAVPALAAKLRSAENLDKSVYADALERIGTPALPVLEALTRSRDEWVGGEASAALARSGNDGNAVLRKLMCDAEPRIRARAANAVVFGKDPRDAEALVAAVQDEDASVRRAAASAIASGAPINAAAVEPLLRMLDEPQTSSKSNALLALGRVHADSATVVPRLKPFLNSLPGNEGDELCDAALCAVKNYGHRAATLAPACAACLGRKESIARRALEAIAAIGGQDAAIAVERVAALADSKEDRTAELALEALFAMGPDATPAVPKLRGLLGKGPTLDRDRLILRALCAVGTPAHDSLADMAPYIVMYYGSIPQAPEFLVRGMASVDPDASIRLIQDRGKSAPTDFFSSRDSQAQAAIDLISQIKSDGKTVKQAVSAGREMKLQQDRGWPELLSWASTIRVNDALERVIALLGKPERVTADGTLEYVELQVQGPSDSFRIRIVDGKVTAISLASRQ